jgi:hypothetical protein
MLIALPCLCLAPSGKGGQLAYTLILVQACAKVGQHVLDMGVWPCFCWSLIRVVRVRLCRFTPTNNAELGGPGKKRGGSIIIIAWHVDKGV